MSFAINGQQVNVQGIKELNDGLTVEAASKKTKDNGLDEVYFSVDGKNFLAYGEALDIAVLSKNQISTISYNGQEGTIVAYENEINSVGEGIIKGALSGINKVKDAITGAVSNTITSIGPTSTVLAGGAMALTGLALWRGGSIGAALGTSAAAGGAVGIASPVGSLLGDLLKNGFVGALKVITVAGGVGFGLSAAAGAIGGVSEALSKTKDYSSIAEVSKEGNNTTVQGKTVNYSSVFASPQMQSINMGSVGSYISTRP